MRRLLAASALVVALAALLGRPGHGTDASWALLAQASPSPTGCLVFPDSLLALDGARVRLVGYAVPIAVGSDRFLLAAASPGCFFCSPSDAPTRMAEVSARHPPPPAERLAVTGTLALYPCPQGRPAFALTEATAEAVR